MPCVHTRQYLVSLVRAAIRARTLDATHQIDFDSPKLSLAGILPPRLSRHGTDGMPQQVLATPSSPTGNAWHSIPQAHTSLETLSLPIWGSGSEYLDHLGAPENGRSFILALASTTGTLSLRHLQDYISTTSAGYKHGGSSNIHGLGQRWLSPQ